MRGKHEKRGIRGKHGKHETRDNRIRNLPYHLENNWYAAPILPMA
jgi:hypothetical protein